MGAETLPATRAASGPRSASDLGLPNEPVLAGAKDSPTAHLRAKIDAQLRTLIAHETGTRTGKDPEDLHQMRVAVRRLRTALKLSSGSAVDDARAELKWLGGFLGEVRDYDVLIEHLRGVVDSFGEPDRKAATRLIAAFRNERTKARRRMNRALGSARYNSLLATLAELTRTAEARDVSVPRLDPAATIRKPYRKLAKAVAALPEDPPDDELHALRIYGKRLRYAAELAVPAAGKKQVKRLRSLIKATKELQDVLGDHQDAVVAAARVRAVADAAADPRMGFVAGRIFERELMRRAEARAAWPGAYAAVSAQAERVLAGA